MHLIALGEKPYQLSSLGELDIEGHPVVGIRASREGHRDINFYFDKKTAMPAKCEWRLSENVEETIEEIFFYDFKECEGSKQANRLVVKRNGKIYITEDLLQFRRILDRDDSKFSKP